MIKVNNEIIEQKQFPDCTPLLKVPTILGDIIEITWNYEHIGEQALLHYIVCHYKDLGYKNIGLNMFYVPNARMDRTYSENEVATLKYFCKFINSLEFDYVKILDPHSPSTEIGLEKIKYYNHSELIERVLQKEYFSTTDIMCYPDAGAMKRYSGSFNKSFVHFNKMRDWNTGVILGLELVGDLPKNTEGEFIEFNVLIVDDICSYGRTMYETAKKLKSLGAKDICLYVSHCEDSILYGKFESINGEKDVNLLDCGYISKVYTSDSICKVRHPKLEIFEL